MPFTMRCKDASGSGPEILCFGIGSIRLPLCGSAAISDSTSHNITTSSPIARFSHTHTHNTYTHSLLLLLTLPHIALHCIASPWTTADSPLDPRPPIHRLCPPAPRVALCPSPPHPH